METLQLILVSRNVPLHIPGLFVDSYTASGTEAANTGERT